ncbi:hypothetical protein [Bordetella sp. BOR01]|uniref:type III secretion apparatus assembly protein SctX n=1 Tax=Bordetella sp. BOR01 TaxID=2854779 RepID=UPI001C46F5F3|nr:hypothetical protein [Bordetella sp. BOR01]MBV7485214.1 hypothetical protein [Bordetella sp. BOR01]
MPDLHITGLTFDRGIDAIAYASKETSTQHLPERQDLPPSSDGVKAQLAQLLDKPNIERFLEDALKPSIGNHDLLMPGRFSQMLATTLDSLSAAAEQGGEDARVLNRAVRLLKEETGMRELVAMYRSALYQG